MASFVLLIFACLAAVPVAYGQLSPVEEARQNAQVYSAASVRVYNALHAGLRQADKQTLLVPDFFRTAAQQRRDRERGNYDLMRPNNSLADHYPFLVLGAYFVDPELLGGRLSSMLRNEQRLATPLRSLPAEFSIKRKRAGESSLFGAGEYAKDGLITITERLGTGTPWFERLHGLVIDTMREAPIKTRFGRVLSNKPELNGDLLQVLPRLYWVTGDERFLAWSRQIADAYVFEVLPRNFGLPSNDWDFKRHRGSRQIKLRDHGNETIVGLSLAFAAEKLLGSSRAAAYEQTLKVMYDRILASANTDGLLYNIIDAQTLKPAGAGHLADNWGYVYGAIYNMYLLTGDIRYRDAVRRVLSNLLRYRGYRWEGDHYDGYADAIEGAIYLVNREPAAEALQWIDSEIQTMFAQQTADGHADRSYLEGNFIRTALLYMALKSRGVHADQAGIGVGASGSGTGLLISIYQPPAVSWSGVVRFDGPRHRSIFNLPLNLFRLNESPEWFTVEPGVTYRVSRPDGSAAQDYPGSSLVAGVRLEAGEWLITPVSGPG